MSTFSAKPEEVERSWFVVDASGMTLGRLTTRISDVLRGKHKPTFTPHVDTGDFVIVINADKIELSGKKLDTKRYYRYTGSPGNLKEATARQVRAKDPERMFLQAVKGHLPKNRLSYTVIKKLKVYAGSEHPHAAQKPQPLPL